MLGLYSEAPHLSPWAPGGRQRKRLGPGLPGQGISGSSLRSAASLSLLFVYASASAVCRRTSFPLGKAGPDSGVSTAQPSVGFPGSRALRGQLEVSVGL